MDTKTLLVQTDEGWARIKVPAEATVTLGPFTPGSRNGDCALRVYIGGKEKQLACIRGVLSFRQEDLAMEIWQGSQWIQPEGDSPTFLAGRATTEKGVPLPSWPGGMASPFVTG